MFERMSNGWELAKESLHVLKMDKELLLFPLMSGMACLVVLASFAVPLWGSDMLAGVFNDQQAPDNPLIYVVAFLFYFVNYFVIIFFNSALVACAVIRFKGGDPPLSDGLRASMNRLPQILGWALVSATVGMILRVIESRSEKAGQFAAALLGMAWTVTTFFVVPVMVVEGTGPVESFKRSLSILKKTWGEALGANFGVGFITFMMSLPGIALIIFGGFVAGSGNAAAGFTLLGLGIFLLLVVSLISTALDSILLAALYLYAAEGSVPQHFDGSLLGDAFSHK